MTTKNENNCPNCGEVIPEEAPGGLCPQCVLQNAETIANATGTVFAAPASIEEIAPHFPDLEILELIGAGGMGAVYKARQRDLDRTVALKILSRELAKDPAFVERFNREARVLARLSHPNIVGVFEYGSDGPFCYLLMEYIDGVNLRQAMRTGGFTPAEALALVQDICTALQFAHEEGILHRDIKPENVLIDSKGRVKIADFGIAKIMGERGTSDFTLTLQGSILGSPHYMAPEQIETPDDVDQRADIYSLGVVLYEMLTGGLPIGRFALPSEKTSVDARIDEIVMRTLEKERQARFQSAEEVRTSVDSLAQSPPPPLMAPSERPSAAKFSLTSALLTSASLILWIMTTFLFLLNSEAPSNFESDSSQVAVDTSSLLPLRIAAILMVAVVAVLVVSGFILGCKALGEIRESGGAKKGLGFACFGTLTYPVLLLFFLAYLVTAFAPGGGSDSKFWILHLLVIFGGLLGAILFVRGVVRWAGGVDDGFGEHHHPGFGGALVAALLLVFILPAVGVGMMVMSVPRDREISNNAVAPSISYASSTQPVVVSEPKAPSPPPEPGINWLGKKPQIALPLFVEPGQTAKLQIFLRHPNGDTTHVAGLGEIRALPESEGKDAVISVGTEDFGTFHRLVIVMGGGSTNGVFRTLQDLSDYEFNDHLPKKITFDAQGRHEYQLANKKKKDSVNRALILEVIVTED